MGIIAWLKQRRLERRKREQAYRLSEIRAGLRRVKTRDLRTHLAIKSELLRIRELKEQLTMVKNEGELQFWYSLFKMCLPSFEALLSASPSRTKRSKGSKKPR